MQEVSPQDPNRQDPQLYARSFADVYDAWYGDHGGAADPAAIVDAFTARLSKGGPILELGSGTGRLATPLAEAGFTVFALDASVPMLLQDQLNTNRLAADMAAPPIRDASVAAVLVAYNTFLNLPDRRAQQRCLHEVSRVLAPGGLLAIDVFVAPVDRESDFGITVTDHPVRAAARLAILTGPDPADPTVIVGSHIELGDATTCRPWRLAYCGADEMDAMAGTAGLELVERREDWSDGSYDEDSIRTVSWYQR